MNLIMNFTNWMWGWPLIITITLVSLIFSIELGFFQFTKFGFIMKNTLGKIFEKKTVGKGTITPFQAVASALASTLGTGNIAGVAVAISLGGPGALFWMWLIAIIAAIAKYAEVTLSILYREKDESTGEYRGGFMYMITNGIGKQWHWLACVWAILMAAEMVMGPAVQANAVAASVFVSLGIKKVITGIICAVLCAVVLVGGIKRIGKLAEKVVPFMAVLYIFGAVIILINYRTMVPEAFSLIFKSAFSGMAPVGGFAGSTFMLALRHGLARGTASNESGMGTAPLAHSAATTDFAARQGLWGIFETFFDTIVVCTMTGLIILVTGVLGTAEVGAGLTAAAFKVGIPGFGDYIVVLSLLFFSFTSMIMNAYYGEVCCNYVFGNKFNRLYIWVVLLAIVVGAVGGLKIVWGLLDTFMALTVAINLVTIAFMRKDVVRATNEFFDSIKGNTTGKEIAK